jgi:hypothetical protein
MLPIIIIGITRVTYCKTLELKSFALLYSRKKKSNLKTPHEFVRGLGRDYGEGEVKAFAAFIALFTLLIASLRSAPGF